MSSLHSLPRKFHTAFPLSTADPYIPPPPGSKEVGHHLSHAYSAFALSSSDKGAVVVSDGWGDLLTTHLNPPPGFVTELTDWDYTLDIHPTHVVVRSLLPNETPCKTFNQPPHLTFRESTSVYTHTSQALSPHKKIFHSTPSPPYSPDLGFSSFDSLGGVYSRVSIAVFGDWNLCGKVMGLSTYSPPSSPIITGDMLGKLTVDSARFEESWIGDKVSLTFADDKGGYGLGSPGLTKRVIVDSSDKKAVQMCADVQRDSESLVLGMLADVRRETGEADLCVAGGLFLNSVVNGRVLDEKAWKR